MLNMEPANSSEGTEQVSETIIDLENEDVNMEVEVKDEVQEETGQKTNLKMKKKKKKEKFLVFVGNLPFSAEEEDIRNHFKDLESFIENVSLHFYSSGRPRGCCYIEFKNKEGYQKALKFNQTEIKGRPIRVEHVVSRTNDERREKFIARQTKKILSQRKKGKNTKWKLKRITSKLKKWK